MWLVTATLDSSNLECSTSRVSYLLYSTDLECSRLRAATVLESAGLDCSRVGQHRLECSRPRNMMQCRHTSRLQGLRSLFDTSSQLGAGQ